jgi:hypothetical protein
LQLKLALLHLTADTMAAKEQQPGSKMRSRPYDRGCGGGDWSA